MKRRAHSVNVVTRSSGCPRSRASWPSRSANRGAFEGGVDFAWDSARIAVELMALYTLQRQGPAEKYGGISLEQMIRPPAWGYAVGDQHSRAGAGICNLRRSG